MSGRRDTFSQLQHTMLIGEALALPYYLLLCRSITHAQRMNTLLERSGISAPYYRAPSGLTDRGCSYAVRVGTDYFSAAVRILRAGGLSPMRVFYSAGDGAYREVTI